MNRVDFDRYESNYGEHLQRAIGLVGCEGEFFAQLKAVHLLRLMAVHCGPTAALDVLDVGCGIGNTAGYVIPNVRKYHGIDVASLSVARAAARHPKGEFYAYDGRRIPMDDEAVDVAFAICVLHHVPVAERARLVRDMGRVVKPGGLVAVYEHNPYNPLTRLVVSRCEFDADAILLARPEIQRLMHAAGLQPFDSEYILFFPFAGAFWRWLERWLILLPLGAQQATFARRSSDIQMDPLAQKPGS